MTVTIVLADDHPIVRKGLRALLGAEPDFSVQGEAVNGLETVRLAEQMKPDILIVDLMMPGMGGLEVIRRIHQASPQTRTIVLSMHSGEAYVLQALKNGAFGYVLKEESHAALIQAVRSVIAGQYYLSPPLSELLIETVQSRTDVPVQDPFDTLTDREREVLHLAAEGHTNAEIAERLFISPRTVESHRAHLMQKLKIRTQTDLVRYALRRGIVPME